MGRDQMRAADADRQAVAGKLRTALDEGRLDLHEYDERLQRAYAAKTYGELELLLTDLPDATVAPAARAEHVTAQWLAQVWGSWFSAVGITTAIWLVSSIAAGGLLYFWPLWIGGPWGLVLVWQTVGGLVAGEPRKQAEARHRKELARERKRELRDAAQGDPPPAPNTDGGPHQPA